MDAPLLSETDELTPSGNKRARVLASALEAFSTLGFDGASTREIARQAAVSHSLVQYHFGTKDDLWKAVVSDGVGRYISGAEKIIFAEGNDTATERFRKLIDYLVRMSVETTEMQNILTSIKDDEKIDWVSNTYVGPHFNIIKKLISDAQSEGGIRNCDPARLYYMITGMTTVKMSYARQYSLLTGRNASSEAEILRSIAFLYELIFDDR